MFSAVIELVELALVVLRDVNLFERRRVGVLRKREESEGEMKRATLSLSINR